MRRSYRHFIRVCIAQSKILYRSSPRFMYFGLIRLRRRYIYFAARIKPSRLMLRHQYQEGIFYSQTHVSLPAAMRFTYELFSPLAEHTPKSLNSAAATTWRMNYMCRTLLNFRVCILAIIEEPRCLPSLQIINICPEMLSLLQFK